jgi:uncharacterized protein
MKDVEVKPGRRFFLRLPHGEDIIASIKEFCSQNAIELAAFSLGGSVSSHTIGTLDQRQQVYVTDTVNEPREIISCSGTVTLKADNPFVYAHAVLADDTGRTSGGRLFPVTRVYAVEADLQELEGDPGQRVYDRQTGMLLW